MVLKYIHYLSFELIIFCPVLIRIIAFLFHIIQDIIPTLKIELTKSKIMNQLSYEVANNRFRNLHFEFKGDLRKSIQETLSLLTPS